MEKADKIFKGNKMNWISVKKKKPKLGQQVICYYKGNRPYDNSVYEGYRILYYLKFTWDVRKRVFSDKSNYFHDLNIGETNWPVTHWIELPSKPKDIK